jgi:formylglycine-generating enzyme required for sulfatase activity
MEQKTVFISYRRSISKHLARSIYQDLKMNGWDVFLDVNTIDSGDFDRIILNQIAARAHFILLISKGSLERCANSGDWVLREIEEAVRLGRNIVPIVEDEVKIENEIAYLPESLREVISKKNALPLPHFFFDPAMEMLRNRFLKTPEYVKIQETPAIERAEVQQRLSKIETEAPAIAKQPSSLDLMPQPFAWIEIPNKGYSMAKYPVTNAQFAEFIKAGGYKKKDWWTKEGWEKCQEGWHGATAYGKAWTEPYYWQDAKWNEAEQPVVGVSWFEALAFCLWLSYATGEKIVLPTEDQWQYAAQGDDGRTYPWGNDWDSSRCRNSVGGNWGSAGYISSVRLFEGKDKGDSPFGVVDMAGNVWEWCLTDYDDMTNYINRSATYRVLRGTSWYDSFRDNFRCDYRYGYNPVIRVDTMGFRLCRSN